MATSERHEFKAEVQKLLHILSQSLYTNREIFLRELISNASDALDKVRFTINRGDPIQDPGADLAIHITLDPDRRLLTITDSGVGMTRDELIQNIGSIGRSGSEEFQQRLQDALHEQRAAAASPSANAIIGRFGVGFYSVFMVAERVVLTTCSAKPGAWPWRWESDGQGLYELTPTTESLHRGTRIEIHLREDALEYADPARLREVIKQHSSFIEFPIYVDQERVNTIAALWREPKFQISTEQYDAFYRYLTHSDKDPLEVIHISVDAPTQFTALLFAPEEPRDFWNIAHGDMGLDLYVKRVMVQRRSRELCPDYLGFLTGLVDTEDLPLNISRQTLQENAVIRQINQTITRQVLTHLEKMATERPDTYIELWRLHGRTLKHGYGDFDNRDRIAPLLRFNTSSHNDVQGLTSLAEYVGRMKPGQRAIYYVAGPNRDAVLSNPHLDLFRQKDLEVLFLYEPLDEFAMDALQSFRGIPLQGVEHVDPASLEKFRPVTPQNAPHASQDPGLSDEDMRALTALMELARSILGGKIADVRLSRRLTDNPACLVSTNGATASHMHKILSHLNRDAALPAKILEINPGHPLIRNCALVATKASGDAWLHGAIEQLLDACLLADGLAPDPHTMARRMTRQLEHASGWRVRKPRK